MPGSWRSRTRGAASDALAAAQALADIQAALADLENADNYGTSVTDEMAGTYSQYVTATSSDPTVTVLKPLAPGGKSVTVTADLPARTTEPALYSHSQVTQAEDGFDGAMAQLCESLSGSSSGNGDGGLLGGAASWQRAIVTQGVFNNAQNAYNDIQKVEKNLDNVETASNPGAAIDSLNRLQSDLTPLINSAQDAVNGMTGGNQALRALGQSEPYSDSDISDAQTPLTAAMPFASASNASNPIQKAVKDGSTYDAEHPIAAGVSALEPAARTLIGQGSEHGEAQKALFLPFKTASAVSLSPKAAPSAAPEAAQGHASPASATEKSPLTPMPAGELKPSEGKAHAKASKPAAKSALASTGSDAVAAAIGAATLLAAGVAAELLKKKENRK